MQTDLKRTTMEVFLGVCLVLSETLLLAFGLYTLHTAVLSFWICLISIIASELLTQFISFAKLKDKSIPSLVCHFLQFGIIYRIIGLLSVEKKQFDKDLRTIHRLRLLRAVSGNLVILAAIGLTILTGTGSYVPWIPFVGILAVTTISVCNLTQTHFFLALLWRFCELLFRLTSLLVLAMAYTWWALMALVLHWTAMFLWCFTHDLLQTKRRHDNLKTIFVNFRSSLILCSCYVDIRPTTSLKRTVAYYVIMLVENWILFAAWVIQGGWKQPIFVYVTVTMAGSCVVMVVAIAVHCLMKRKTKVVKGAEVETSVEHYVKRQTNIGHSSQGRGLTPIAEVEIYEELSDSPRSEDSGNTSPGSHTRLVTPTELPNSVTTPITVYTIAGQKFKLIDGALESVQYSADQNPARPRGPLPREPQLDSPYAITELVQGQGHGHGYRPRKCGSWSGRRGERSLSPEYETCGPASDSIYSSIPKVYHRQKLRPKLPRHHRQSSSSSGYDVTESDQSFSSPSPPQTMERECPTSFTEIMDNLSKDSAISMTDEKLRLAAVAASRPAVTSVRARVPVTSSSLCTAAPNSIFGESDFERSEYNSTVSCAPERRPSKDERQLVTNPFQQHLQSTSV